MGRWKKILSLLMIVCMLCPCAAMVAHAASAEVRFSDPSTTVGAEVEIAVKISSSDDIETLSMTLTYDADMLRFISGDNASGGSGTITMNCDGDTIDGGYTLKFQALAEGTGNVEISQSSGTDTDGSELDITEGSSAVTIGPGDPSLIQQEEGAGDGGTTGAAVADGPQVEIEGAKYTVTNNFSDALIPEGFERSEMLLEGQTCQVALQPISNMAAFYLTPVAGGDPDFFLYDGDQGSFFPFESVSISSDRYIVLLRNDGTVNLPKRYQETVLTLNGKEFPAWQDVDKADYYVLYALNADGQKEMYQYDTVDKTYQRYVEHIAEKKEKKSPKGWWNKVLQFVSDFLDIVLIIGLMLMLVLIAFLVVIGVKLHNRNLELDDLYDEYDIDPDRDELPAPKAKKPAPGKGIRAAVRRNADEPAVRVPVKTMSLKEEDLFDDYDSDDYDDDDFDDYDSDDYDDDDFGDDGYDDDDDGYDDDDDDDGYDDDDDYGGSSNDMIDDLDDLLNMQSQRKRGQKKGDTFQVDFIDLD